MALHVVNPAKKTRTTVDTLLITPTVIAAWKAPPFQRPLRVNDKVLRMADELKTSGGVISGVITIGKLGRDTYLIDGQHRIHAFGLSGLQEGYADVRLCHLDDMSEMAEEFVALNSRISNMRPDDFLRGMEESNPRLHRIHKRCPFIGYDMIRRKDSSPILSMSVVLRAWCGGSATEAPSNGGMSATRAAEGLLDVDVDNLCAFLTSAYQAWGKDAEYQRLWGSLNMVLCMWLYRRTVLAGYSGKSVRLTATQFEKAIMALSASKDYLDWLVGRLMSDTNRSPAYARIKTVFTKRLTDDFAGKPLMFPAPSWSVHSGGRK